MCVKGVRPVCDSDRYRDGPSFLPNFTSFLFPVRTKTGNGESEGKDWGMEGRRETPQVRSW